MSTTLSTNPLLRPSLQPLQLENGTDGRTWTGTVLLTPADFKSAASAISPHRHLIFKEPSLTTLSSYHIFLIRQHLFKKFWWIWRDLNPHAFQRLILSQLRLPFRHISVKMVVLSGNAPDSYASPAINFVISKAAFFKLQDHFKW